TGLAGGCSASAVRLLTSRARQSAKSVAIPRHIAALWGRADCHIDNAMSAPCVDARSCRTLQSIKDKPPGIESHISGGKDEGLATLRSPDAPGLPQRVLIL